MKKVITLLAVGLLMSLSACGGGSGSGTPEPSGQGGSSSGKQVKVGITQIVEHPSLDATREGFIAALKDAGYKEGENLIIDYKNAQGDMSTNTTIAQQFVADKVDLIFAISTPSAQAAVQATKDIPVIFSAVTDPLGAKLVAQLDKPGANVTGYSDTHPEAIKKTMEAIKRFFPDAKKVGIIYNAGEQNARVNVDRAKEELVKIGLEPVEKTVTNSSEVKQAAESLIGAADVIYIPKDNTVVSAFEAVVQVANEKDIPMFVGETDSVVRGGFAGYGFSYHDLGYSTGKMAVEVLKGKKPADIPVGFPEQLGLMINKKAADEQGVTLTEEMRKDAQVINE